MNKKSDIEILTEIVEFDEIPHQGEIADPTDEELDLLAGDEEAISDFPFYTASMESDLYNDEQIDCTTSTIDNLLVDEDDWTWRR